MSAHAARVPGERSPGRTRISAQALNRVAVQAAAEALGVPAGRVRTSVSDEGGLVVLTVTAPAPLPELGRPPAGGPGLLERAEEARGALGARFSALTGRRVGRVDLEFSGTSVRQERRVR